MGWVGEGFPGWRWVDRARGDQKKRVALGAAARETERAIDARSCLGPWLGEVGEAVMDEPCRAVVFAVPHRVVA